MNILQVVGSLNRSMGGPIEGVLQTSRWSVEAGNEVDLLTMDDPRDPVAASLLAGCAFPVHAVGPVHLNYGYTPRLAIWLRKNLPSYDAVVVNGIWQYLSIAVSRASRQLGVPYVVFPHGMLDPYFKRAFPWKHWKKVVYWGLIERRVLRDAAAVAFTCQQEMVLASESFGGWEGRGVVVGYGSSGPDVDLVAARDAFFRVQGALRGKRIVLFLGRLHPKKGCDLLIEAFAEELAADDDWWLVIAGPDQGGWRERLARMAGEVGIEHRVVWTGMLTGELKWGAFAAAEIFALPSHQENFGIAVVEALSCGVPVLISKQVNIWREIDRCGAGLCDEDSAAGTRAMLRRWNSMGGAARAAMGGAARGCFLQHFEARVAAAALDALLARSIAADF